MVSIDIEPKNGSFGTRGCSVEKEKYTKLWLKNLWNGEAAPYAPCEPALTAVEAGHVSSYVAGSRDRPVCGGDHPGAAGAEDAFCGVRWAMVTIVTMRFPSISIVKPLSANTHHGPLDAQTYKRNNLLL